MMFRPDGKARRTRCRLGLLALLVLLLPPAAVAHEGATGVVKARMDLMESIRDSTKVLTAMYAKKMPYDAGVVEAEARWIAAQAARIAKLFPRGSKNWPSVARPDIWQNWTAFEGLAADLARKSSDLAARAGSASEAEISSDFREMVSVCGSCHRKFRETK